MKKVNMLIILMLSLLVCKGQNLLQEGKLWSNTSIGTMPGSTYRSYFIKFMGDTTINGLGYKKIMKSDDPLHTKWTLNGCIREESITGKVFIFNGYTGKDRLLYDFSLETGDSILTGDGRSYAKVTKVIHGTFGSSSVIRKQICFFDPNASPLWIEGIGSLWGVLEGLNSFYTTGSTTNLMCYSENDQLIFHNSKFNNCFPEGLEGDQQTQFRVDIGNDTTYCSDPNTTLIPMGLKVNIKNGVEPYIYAWECKIVLYGILKPQTASDILNDSTLMSPTLKDFVWAHVLGIKFTLHVTDHAGNSAKESLNVSFSSCAYILGYQVIELVKGDSVWLDAGKPSGSVAAYYWEPFEGLSTPHTSATWCKPTITTDYNIVRVDTFGCICSNLAYEIRIIPTGSETIKSNAKSTLEPFQKGSKVYFDNRKNQDAWISVFSLNGKLLYQCTTSNDNVEVSPVIAKKGTYIVKIAIEGTMGTCKYLQFEQ